MEHCQIGSLTVSRLGIGTGSLPAVDSEAAWLLSAAAEQGIRLIDTAGTYGDRGDPRTAGRAEELIGRWLAGRRREEVVLCTKVDARGFHGAAEVVAALEGSLRRLRTDHVDLCLLHHPVSRLEPVREGFLQLHQQGRIREVGLCNLSGAALEGALAELESHDGRPQRALQRSMDPLRDPHDPHLEELRGRRGLVVMAYGVLAGGFLADRYRPGQPPPPGSRGARGSARIDRYRAEGHGGLLAGLRAVGRARGVEPAAVAVAWALAQPSIDVVLVGASGADQLRATAAGAGLRLSREELREPEAHRCRRRRDP